MNNWSKLFVITPIFLLSSCYYNSEEFLFPEISSACDTLSVSYTEVVQPSLQNYCYNCHSNTTAPQFGANIKLEDHSDVKTIADNGKLYGTMNHESGFSPMPKGGGKLDNCTLKKLQIWINAGSPNN